MRHILLACACASLLIPACNDPENPKPVAPQQDTTFRDLTERNNVLYNLEQSYNQRDGAEYERLLDDDFIFFFSPEDYASGTTPAEWNRAADVPATRRLLDDAFDVKLDIEFDEPVWEPVAAGPHGSETWYTTTVTYTFTMRFQSDLTTTYVTSGHPAVQFTVREAVVKGRPQWRLIEWKDRPTPDIVKSANASQATSWGQLKAIFN